MRIGIDARFYGQSGVGRYLRNLIVNLRKIDKKNEYFIFLLAKDYKNFQETNNFKKVLADFKWYGFAEQFKYPGLLKKIKLDLMHFPHFNVPIFYQGKFIVTIHDLIHQHFQTKQASMLNPLIYNFKQFGYKKVFKSAISKSEKILVPSNNVSEFLVKEWGIKASKITITQEGVDEDILSIDKKISKDEIYKVLKKFGIRLPFIYYVGNAHPHKNVEGLIKSFLRLKNNHKNLQLVLSGFDHFFWQRIKKEFQDQDKDIIYTNQVTDEELVALYKGSEVFVLPSFEEGFGIPLLEAMACKTPIVSSSGGSLKEVGADAVVYFNPSDLSDMTSKIALVVESKKLRNDLIKKGLQRVKIFSWKKLAQITLGEYQRCG